VVWNEVCGRGREPAWRGALPGADLWSGPEPLDLTFGTRACGAGRDPRTPGPRVRPLLFGCFWDGAKVMVQGRVAAFFELRDGLRQQGRRATARPVFSFLRHEGRAAWDRRNAGPWGAPLLFGWLLGTVRKSWFRGESLRSSKRLRDRPAAARWALRAAVLSARLKAVPPQRSYFFRSSGVRSQEGARLAGALLGPNLWPGFRNQGVPLGTGGRRALGCAPSLLGGSWGRYES
jgi:hypothetical protein